MAKVDYVKINNTINYIQNVAYLSELPVANENSADFVSVNNELYVKQVNGTTYTYAKVGGSGGTEAIEKTIDPNGGEPLVFTEDFTQEEFDKLLNGSALLQIWSMPNVLSYILKPYAIQIKEDMNAYAIRLSCLTDIESGNHLYMLLIKRDGVITYQIENVSSGGASEPTVINLNTYVPSTAKNGTLDSSVLNTLQESDQNYIVFNNEIFKLADKQHNEGYLVYSHNGHDTTGCFFQKCITITLSTRGWVLEEQENQAKLTAGSGITIANNVISSSGGGTTSDTAYVSNSTLYIEESTTAGGGSSTENIVNATHTTELDALYSVDILNSNDFISFYEINTTPSMDMNIIDAIKIVVPIDEGQTEEFILKNVGEHKFCSSIMVNIVETPFTIPITGFIFDYNDKLYCCVLTDSYDWGFLIDDGNGADRPLTELDVILFQKIVKCFGINVDVGMLDFKHFSYTDISSATNVSIDGNTVIVRQLKYKDDTLSLETKTIPLQ